MDSEVTQILAEVSNGDERARERLLQLVYADLKAMAAGKLAGLSPGQTLQPTALVHEAYLKLVGSVGGFESRAHFFGAASRAMRNILVDIARRKATVKHGGSSDRIDLDPDLVPSAGGQHDRVIDIDQALTALEDEEPRAAKVVELRFFAGLTESEAAEVLGTSERTVRREWSFARAWLQRKLADSELTTRSRQGQG